MKKLLVFALVIGAGFLVIVSCNPQTQPSSTNTPAPAATVSNAEPRVNTQALNETNTEAVVEGTYVIAGVTNNGRNCADLGSENANKSDDNLHRFTCGETSWQKWNVRKDPSRPGRYLISWAGAPDKYWGVEGRDNNAHSYVLWERRGDHAYQSWIFLKKGPDTYHILNDGSGYCLDYSSAGNPDKENLRLSNCNSGASEVLWRWLKR